MFNIAVIKLKDLIKYIFTLVLIIIIIYILNKYFFENESEKVKLKNVDIFKCFQTKISQNLNYPINHQSTIICKINNENLIDENNENPDKEFYGKIIEKQIPLINIEPKEKVTENETKKDEQIKEEKEEAEKSDENKKENKETKVVTQNPLADKFTDKLKGVKIKNETKFELNDEIINPENLDIQKKNIIIFHTHTCESYTQSEKYKYKPTGNFRTTDLNYSVARVGDELEKYLKDYGFNVIHDKTYHDYPNYNGSYTRSFSTVSNILKNNKADIIIDLHRDAIGSYSSYAPTCKIGDDLCAQAMFVMGSNGGGLKHPNWQSNLKFAVKIQEKGNELYPGFFKPIILRNSRYNQNLGKAACIIEIGSTGNTLDQCLNSMKYLSEIIGKSLK